MICPKDQQPCTWDHSRDCYQNCIYEIEDERIAAMVGQGKFPQAQEDK